MNRLILVKYASEIFLKGQNRGKFEKQLRNNIKLKLKGLDFKIISDQGRYFIEAENIEEAADRVRRVFGIAEVCIVTVIERDMQAIKEESLRKVIEANQKTFKIETNRANKLFQTDSLGTSREVGGYVLNNFQGELKVDVKNPECRVNIEIREKVYIYTNKDKIKGAGGLPYGMNGSTMLMLSGGLDSPVAGYQMARRGVELHCVYYHSHPYTSERAKDKVKDLAKILSSYTEKVNLYVVPFTEIQMEIMDKCREDELTIIMRRFMMRIACGVAEKNGVQSVCSGESIGQVASQTMEGLIVSDDCADRPAFRPLIAMDKEDIIKVAREIGTFETSILPYEDCCTIFVPKHPKIKPKLELIRKSESVLAIDELVEKAINDMELFKF
ncbi:tRNA uracil 4-sulfurtransferase ThiI [Clostridium gasigenes]|uniref:Probable tRNA sulfurtransferase n=1 Tax=Clostridium gasigenes TaxID=94869 RepID=A0A1H0TV11_9CLOT|nr:tRNA uracil 4-sulfurtransferase ThiI [Clostridium gasigenes]MBB6624261.1 tRNA 4-thiouridine(8) synthase ThiI [Clostridium gasigenes]MBU3089284.1 tRNA 4-thiouridine(8) synthase ThiI [Clostridium gasigenes]MBU3105279.1 tRNA 4-thiouridine(8) synthase ThiI [Clostridium gasigenes]MBU3132109.1 tRNA 4-thiouridine(8) synthase ThiI [Clostridium gasigenes]NKF06975.1 tRNA 4-thiouridine(8) synthase ThiI [Clostridium gasigenes]